MSTSLEQGSVCRPPTAADIQAIAAHWSATPGSKPFSRRALPRGQAFWRVVSVDPAVAHAHLLADATRQAAERAAVLHPSRGAGRFTPPRRSDGLIVPAGYAALDPGTAVWETVLRDIPYKGSRLVGESSIRIRFIARVVLLRDVFVLSLLRPGVLGLATPTDPAPDFIQVGPAHYPTTVLWMNAAWDHLPQLGGLAYESHMTAGGRNYVFVEDNTGAVTQTDLAQAALRAPLFEVTEPPRSLAFDPLEKQWVAAQAAQADAAVEFP